MAHSELNMKVNGVKDDGSKQCKYMNENEVSLINAREALTIKKNSLKKYHEVQNSKERILNEVYEALDIKEDALGKAQEALALKEDVLKDV